MIEMVVSYLAIAAMTSGVLIGFEKEPAFNFFWIITGLIWPLFLVYFASCMIGDGIKYLRRCR